MESMATAIKKSKLRTAGDVLSRLRWESVDVTERTAGLLGNNEIGGEPEIVMGYLDRIEGPMEKNVRDYVSAKHGSFGDLPEHRIQYFRQNTLDSARIDSMPSAEVATAVLWDRNGRVDKIFGSGNGSDAKVAAETVETVRIAVANMIRIEEEKEQRRADKAKQRARRAGKRVAAQCIENSTVRTDGRFQWSPSGAPWFVYSSEDQEWVPGSLEQEKDREQTEMHELSVVTWNVLFDIFDDGGLEPGENPEDRWKLLCSMLQSTEADLISLQEVTPSFVRMLCETPWVMDDYVCSASTSSAQSVTPSGVMILWRRSTLIPFSQESLFECMDVGRNRSMLAALCPRSSKESFAVLFAATHLPADRAIAVEQQTLPKNVEKTSRKLARKRELAAILGQMERVTSRIITNPSRQVTPILAGDFNCQDDELLDGFFAESSKNDGHLFRDTWLEVGDGPGLTWDMSNPRAARSSSLVGSKGVSRRIDRIFVGPTTPKKNSSASIAQLTAVSAELLGDSTASATPPPSDHFGVHAVFRTNLVATAGKPDIDIPSAWAANAPSSPHYLLALVLDNPRLERLKAEHDPESSLPLLHISLLHGFVEADYGCLDLVRSTVTRAMHIASSRLSPPEALSFSLGVFEHRASATLLAQPNIRDTGSQWLEYFYCALRGMFLQCDEQEKHSNVGWQPHVTLGVAGSSSAAREIQARWMQIGEWVFEEQMTLRSVDVLRRGASGKFQSIASLPIESGTLPSTSMTGFLHDGGASIAKSFDQKTAIIIAQIERACRRIEKNKPIQASVLVGGSSKLGVALPGLSDVDATVRIIPLGGLIGFIQEVSRGTAFLQTLFDNFAEEVPTASARFRPGGDDHTILTIRVPEFPSVDLSLCACDSNGEPIDQTSQISLDSIQDCNALLSALKTAGGNMLVQVFQGALRIVKLWAFRHNVYGAATGFLGGSSWAIWVAHCALEMTKHGFLDLEGEISQLIDQLARRFFETASKWRTEDYISIGGVRLPDVDVQRRHIGNLVVLAPNSNANLTRSSTQSTSATTLAAIQRAAATLALDQSSLSCLLKKMSEMEFVEEYPHIIILECRRHAASSSSGPIKPAEVKAWGSRQFLFILVELEKKIDPAVLRPKSCPVKIDKRFIWLVGVQLLQKNVATIQNEVEKVNRMLTHENNTKTNGTSGKIEASLSILSSSEAVDVFTALNDQL